MTDVKTIIARFDDAAKHWGWQEDQGYDGDTMQRSLAEYEASKQALLDHVKAVEAERDAAKTITECYANEQQKQLADLKAAERERDELRSENERMREWNPIGTCPLQESVDLWCVYGGEEYAQYEGGTSIGKLVPNRFKTEEYGFFGNQSNNGIPQGNAPDLVPVAWRKAVPQCPATLIAKELGIPVTFEEARATLSDKGDE